MRKNALLTLTFILLLTMVSTSGVMASSLENDFDLIDKIKSKSGEPAEGFDSKDKMYIKADTNHYWNGRYSNGRVYSEYIANELAGDYDNLVNYAVGGSFTGVLTGTKGEEGERSNWSEWLKGWGGVEQTERFVKDVEGKADPNALYLFSTVLNDTYAVEILGKERAAELSSDNSLQMLQNLVESGAKYIVVDGVSANAVNFNPTDFRGMVHKQVVKKIEDYLAKESTPNDVKVIFGEGYQLKDNIEEQGFEKFGYKSMGFYLISDWVPEYGYGLVAEDNSDIFPTNEEEDIHNLGRYYSTDSKYYDPEAEGLEPNDFYSYDEYHITNRTHRHKATYYLNSDISTADGTFKKVYNGKVSPFAKAMDEGIIPSEYSMIYTFGASDIDSGRGLEVTTKLVENRDGNEQKDEYKEADKKFTDIVEANAHYAGINALTKQGIINGYPLSNGKKKFKPYASLSRVHSAVLLSKALDLKIPDNIESNLNAFRDISANQLYAGEIAATYQARIFKGSNGTFNGNESLTREQMATVLVKAYDLKSPNSSVNVNLDNVDASHKENVQILADLKITNQLDNFRPNEEVTRGQFATFVYKTMKTVKSKS